MKSKFKPHYTSPQTFSIDGVKFFKKHLDNLRKDSIATEILPNPITTSEITVFMILHQFVDEMGQIRTLTVNQGITKRKQLCISNIAKDYQLKYETVKKAFDSLLSRNYIAEVHTNAGMHYEIVDYAACNQQSSISKEELSYFYIPHAIYEERLFGKLIQKRFHKGPIVLLELSQFFTRQIGTNKRSVEEVTTIQGTRKMADLKARLNTTAMRVRDFLEIIKNVFTFKPVEETIKEPAAHRNHRKRTFFQICIKKFTFTLNKSCFVKNEHSQERKLFATYRKEMAARIKNAKIPLAWRDMLDINNSISRMVKIGSHLNVIGKTKQMLDYTVSNVADKLEELHLSGTLTEIKSIGAFVNANFSNLWREYQDTYLELGDRQEVMVAYHNVYGSYPSFIGQRS